MFDMKRLLPAIVLVFSLSAMGLYVWKSSQKGKVTAAEEKATTDASQGDFLEPKIIVTDEEVRATRDAMMSTSKSGLIMSEEDIRKMLEEEKKAEKNTQDINNNPENYIGKEMYIALSNDGNVNLDLGDNVWKPREGGSHSDIVVSPTEAIGGNLSNTVKKVKIDHPIVIKKVRILGPKNKN
jgi:hypothetical protein